VNGYLGPALESTGTKILDYDWNWPYDSSAQCAKTCWTTNEINQVVNPQVPYFSRPADVAGVAWHCYTPSPTSPAIYSGAEQSFLPPSNPGLISFVDECSGTYQYGTAANVSNDSKIIVGGIDNGSSGVMFYNLALNPQADGDGPHALASTDGGGCQDCRGVVTINPGVGATPEVEYYLLSELARAFAPGATVIGTNY
jgi:glucosylceramidase